MKKVYIMSAKFAPGHFSHMLAYYKLFEEAKCYPVLYLDRGYEAFVREISGYRYEYIDVSSMPYADIVLIYNLSRFDQHYIRLFEKANNKTKFIFVYHEPWLGIKEVLHNLFSRKESVIESIKVIGRYIFAIPELKKSSLIIVPSKKAYKDYKKFCFHYNKKCCIFPLVFTDECNQKIDLSCKKYLSFISTASRSKNFEMFLSYVKYKSKKSPDLLFQIATRSNIDKYIDEELQKLIESGQLIVNHGHDLSNEEINHAYNISSCVWLLYSRSTQSGVMCKAMMFGSPVIGSDLGSFSEVIDGSNGIILSEGYSLKDIEKSHEKIMNDLEFYSKNSRESFLKKFYYKNQISKFSAIIERKLY